MNAKLLTTFAQGTEEWFNVRLGKLTSSRIADAVTQRKRKPKDGSAAEPLQKYLDLRMDLAVERVTRKPTENFVSWQMKEGKEKEPLARGKYELQRDAVTVEIGFALHPEMEWCGASPDGLVGDDGLVEFKCPMRNTHAEYLLSETVPEIYVPQMMWQMACTGRRWCDFVSFHPDFPDPLDLFIRRLNRDPQAIAVMEAQAAVFLKETADLTMRLTHGLEGMLRESLVPRAVIPNQPFVVPLNGSEFSA